ncbi:response regulator transcription factor [Pleomorphochaeta sp. DL1XJH-081]|uniref:response regulator transcription factor n=1 Tax=Pleomorphochaeta sp. DL1XJH-081 TaxID=3409690 RepID=UPI003BB5D5DE
MSKIFVVEDNAGLLDAIGSYLEVEGHKVVSFDRIAGVYEAAKMGFPDLMILDVMLPDGDGFHLARRIKKDNDIPILFLTARTSESDRITGFEIGADDYVVKPFSMRELVLRVRSILGRTQRDSNKSSKEQLHTWMLDSEMAEDHKPHKLELNENSHLCLHDGIEVKLTATEWKILSFLAEREKVVVSREKLLGMCLDYLAEGSERAINTHMKNIRAKLTINGWIETVRGFGYRFIGKVEHDIG